MHRAFKPESILKGLLCAAFAFQMQGCTSKVQHPISMGEWINMVAAKAGYESTADPGPYYVNIPESSIYYKAVQSSIDWGVLDPSVPFDPKADLTREWTAYTLVHLMGQESNETDNTIRDLSASRFSSEVSSAVSSGLMDLDAHHRFHPKDLIEKDDAEAFLDEALSWMDHKTIEDPHTNLEWADDAEIEERMPDAFDEESMTAEFDEDAPIHSGEIVHWEDENGQERWYQIKEPVESDLQQNISSHAIDAQEQNNHSQVEQKSETKEKHNAWKMEEADFSELLEHVDMSNSFTVDFSKAEIFDPVTHERISGPQSGTVKKQSAVEMRHAVLPLTVMHGFDDIEVKTTISDSTIRAEVKKKINGNSYLKGTFSMSSIKPTYDFDATPFKVKKGYYSVSCTCTQSIKADYETHQKASGSLKTVPPEEFCRRLTDWYLKNEDRVKFTVPIAEAKIPVPDAPFVYVNLKVSLKVSAEGKAELTLSQTNETGMEIRDGSIRPIKNHTNSAKAVLEGNTSCKAGAGMGLSVGPVTMADIGLNAGAEAGVSATVHLYDSKGRHNQVQLDSIPADLVSESAEGNGSVLTCADAKTYWVMDAEINSDETFCGRIGFNKKWDILDKNNNTLIPGSHQHYENWQSVPKCTRGDRETVQEDMPVVNSSILELEDTLYLLSPGSSVQIAIHAIPKGISIGSLQYSSSNPQVASVSASGLVTAYSEGSAVITVKPPRGASANCSIHVRIVQKS